jgi:hypothetical protein
LSANGPTNARHQGATAERGRVPTEDPDPRRARDTQQSHGHGEMFSIGAQLQYGIADGETRI